GYDRQIGERVRELRKQRGWTSQELAKLWGKTPAQVTNFEKGNGRGPAIRLETLAELAVSLDAPPAHPMTLADFLWPILWPTDAAERAHAAEASFEQQMQEAIEQRRQRYLASLERATAVGAIDALGRLARDAPADAAVVADMLVALADRRDRQHEALMEAIA